MEKIKSDDFNSTLIENVKQVVKKKYKKIIILIIIAVLYTVLEAFFFRGYSATIHSVQMQLEQLNYESGDMPDISFIFQIFNWQLFDMIMLEILMSILITGGMIQLTFNAVFDKQERVTFIKYLNYFLYSLLLYVMFAGALIALMISMIILGIIPIIGILFLILLIPGSIVGVILFFGYFRFLPYVAYMEGADNVMVKNMRYVKGHLGISIIILLTFGIFAYLLGLSQEPEIMSSAYIGYVILLVFRETVLFLQQISDVSLIITSRKALEKEETEPETVTVERNEY